MDLVLVTGNVVSTVKDAGLTGFKLLLCRPAGADGKPTGDELICVDAVGAGPGELCFIARGSSARQTEPTRNRPVDAVVCGIVDSIESDGRVVFRKHGKPDNKPEA
ncbi:MAG: EutN/CcmL family microcompartment protein [bacterium]|nr:EutN/CcmL family microcompartment protein [bacterium]